MSFRVSLIAPLRQDGRLAQKLTDQSWATPGDRKGQHDRIVDLETIALGTIDVRFLALPIHSQGGSRRGAQGRLHAFGEPDRHASDYDTRAGSTRRQALMTMVTGGVLGMLAVGPAAAQCGGPDYHGRVSLAERRRYAEAKRHFWTTVNAFNDKTIPVEQSRLWQVLDPDVAIYDFDSGNQIMARGLRAQRLLSPRPSSREIRSGARNNLLPPSQEPANGDRKCVLDR